MAQSVPKWGQRHVIPSTDDDLLRAADGAFESGRLGDARTAYAHAFEVASRQHDAPVMARAVLGLGGLWVNEQRGPDEYARYHEQLQQSLRALADDEPLLSARLAARLAAEKCYADGAPLSEARDAVESVRGFGAVPATCEALSLLHHLLLAPHDRVEREQVAHELTKVAARDDSNISALLGLVWNTVDAFLADDNEASRLLARLRVRAEELDHTALTFLARMIELMVWLRSGRIADVQAALDEVHVLGVEAGEVDATPWIAGQLMSVRWLQGRQHEVLDAARSLADSPELTRDNRVYPAVWAAIAASAGSYDEARVALARVNAFGSPPSSLAPSSMWLVTMFAVVEAIRHLDDQELATQAYGMLAPFADLSLIGSLAIVCFGSVHRSLAWCATVRGDLNRAIEHFWAAVEHDLRIGNLPMLAITRAELGKAVAPTDQGRASELYQQAIEAGTRFGMVRWVEQWQDQYRALHAHRTGQDVTARWIQSGKLWEVDVGATHVVIPHSIGMTMIQTLIASPYTDVPVEALTGVPYTLTRQTVLDDRARDELRQRISELQLGIDEADRSADSELSERLTDELEAIKSELARTLRIRGLSRDFPTPSEHARTSVQKAIRRALEHIAEQTPELADKLKRSIHTGAYCRFHPTPDLPQAWTTSR
jgi:hypothetical protein